MSLLEHDAEDVSLEAHLAGVLDDMQEELHTALPGRVVRYDAEAQTADVEPMIRRALRGTDGTTVRETMPVIRAVPLCWPRAGGFFVHMPLAAGDFVLLVCCERDLARWRQAGEASDPIDRRHHHLAHAVAIPGVYPRTRQLTDTPSDALVIGREGGATIQIRTDDEIHLGSGASGSVALASLIDAVFAAIRGAANGDAIPAAVNAAFPPGSTVAATKVRAE